MLSRNILALRSKLWEHVSWNLGQAYNASRTKVTAESLHIADSWQGVHDQGHEVNPCGSLHHPSVKSGFSPTTDKVKSLQEAYSPASECFGCGPAAGENGMHLRSFRAKTGLVADFTFSEKYCAFPELVSGGAISTVLDCHGNWAAALHLMDEHYLPRPPLTVTYNSSFIFKQPTRPDKPVILTAKVINVSKTSDIQPKISLEVELAMYGRDDFGARQELVTGYATYRQTGPLRSF